MKTILLILICLLAETGYSQYWIPGQIQGPGMNQRSSVTAPNPLDHPPQSLPPPENFKPRDPVRIINGQTEWANGNGWFWFEGRVVEVQSAGIRVMGLYTKPGGNTEGLAESLYEPREFFVRHFPYSVAENDRLSSAEHYTAKSSTLYRYTTVMGGSRTIHCLNYGEIWTPPQPTAEQIAQAETNALIAKAKAAADKAAAQARALAANQDLAAKGDAYGLLRMGERFRDGDGVEKDLGKARDYFTKAVAAGSPSAQAALEQLPK